MKKLLMLSLLAAAFVLPNCGKKCDSKTKKDSKKSHKVQKASSKKGESKKGWSMKGWSKKGESKKGESKKGLGFSEK
jgi:protein involved in sex pheromone biosynthesis